jgi:recombination protein RecA
MAIKKKATKKTTTKTVVKEPVKAEKKDKVDVIRLQLLEEFGSNAVIKGSDMEKCDYGRISTGSISLDLALGGGIPVGKIIQISGAKSTSKTTIANHIIKCAQSTKVDWIWTERRAEKGREIVEEHLRSVDGLICGYHDVEGTNNDTHWLNRIGVDTNKWIYCLSGGMEETFNVAHSMQLKGVNLQIIDSIDALEPILYYDTNAGDSARMGVKPQQIGEFFRKWTATNNKLVKEGKLPCTLVLLNQVREKIGAYGNPEYVPGGRALDFYPAIDLRLRRGDWITIGKDKNKQIIGQIVLFKTEKNKTYRQQQTGEFDLYFDEGGRVEPARIDNAKEIVMEGIAWGVIEQAGSWFKYKGNNLAQGADKTLEVIMQDKDLFNSIKGDLFSLVQREEKLLIEKKGA